MQRGNEEFVLNELASLSKRRAMTSHSQETDPEDTWNKSGKKREQIKGTVIDIFHAV